MTYTVSPSVRLAIVGGGIGGLVLAIALLEYRHIDVQVYEATSSFKEVGAGVSLAPNAQRAVKLLGREIQEAFERHITSSLEGAAEATSFMTHIAAS